MSTETTAGHTPGPWERQGSAYVYACDLPAKEGYVCLSSSKANAQLIAAAPELLEAAQALVSLSESGIFNGSDAHPSLEDSDAVACARAAIAKAIG